MITEKIMLSCNNELDIPSIMDSLQKKHKDKTFALIINTDQSEDLLNTTQEKTPFTALKHFSNGDYGKSVNNYVLSVIKTTVHYTNKHSVSTCLSANYTKLIAKNNVEINDQESVTGSYIWLHRIWN